MIVNGDTLKGQNLKTQVCIVGSGQAGITLAWYLLKKGIDVTILEGSRVFDGRDPNEKISPSYDYNENIKLYNGVSDGVFAQFETEFLTVPTPSNHSPAKERDRVYGGTSTHWGGQSRPINASTFEERPGFPGWPICREDLDPYYNEASQFLELYGDYYKDGIAGYNFTTEFWAEQICGKKGFNLEMEGFGIEMYQGVPTENLQFQARKVDGKTIGESDARVILNASLLKIESTPESKIVNKLTVGYLEGTKEDPTYNETQQFTITADTYVLACGAVANARQLLLSDIGNENDQVGRYLSAQPLAQNVNAVSTSTGYLNSCASNLLQFNNSPTIKSNFGLGFLVGELTPTAQALKANQLGSCWFGEGGTGNYYHELLPESESRITLTKDKVHLDVFNQQQTRATWILNKNEGANYDGLANLFKTAVQSINTQQAVNITPWDTVKRDLVFNGHHLCTTRMSEKPEDGVVDKNLKVHTMHNLYCAGSSVWSTAGIVNPTFSIVAFSIRLAEHLASQLSAKNKS